MKNSNVPRLRFPEFQNVKDWEIKPLKKIAKVIAGQSPKSVNYNDKKRGVPFYQGKTNFGAIYLDKPEKWTTQTTKLANNGDILMSVRAPVGELNIATEEICIGRGIASIQVQQNKWYVYYYLSKIQKFIVGNGGSIFDSINKRQIENINVSIPKKPKEQQKIADCLSSLDDLISAQAKKLTALQQHKKGLMQNLFPADGETCPKLRFHEFQNAGEWEEKRLRDVLYILQGFGFPEKYQGKKDGTYPFYKVSDISNTLASGEHFIEKSANYVDNEDLVRLRAKPVPRGTTIFAKIGEAIRSNRRVITTRESVIDNNTAGVKSKKGKTVDLFVFYLFSQVNLIDHAGGVVPSVNKTTIENIPITCPKLPEQQKIADCLSSLDNLISAQAKKLTALQQHKKGLMQNLFPNNAALE